jgi:hypothetical protein
MCFLLSMNGCVTEASSLLSPSDESRKVLLIGQVVTVLTGDRARKFAPAVKEVELIEQTGGARYRIAVDGSNTPFAVFIPPGRYEMTRVKIHEGPFLSIADLGCSFSIEEGPAIVVGTWRFGVESPRYGRMVFVSMVLDNQGRQEVENEIRDKYPALVSDQLVTVLPQPAEMQSRLYEVAPYPRISRYFRRHYW